MTGEELRDAFLALWRDHGGVLVRVDSARPGFVGPDHLRGHKFVLDYDRFAAIPIDDLDVDESAIRATLSFSRTPVRTCVPWSAVLAMEPRGPKFHDEPQRPKLRAV